MIVAKIMVEIVPLNHSDIWSKRKLTSGKIKE